MPSLPSPKQEYKDVEPRLGIKEVNGLVLVRKFSEDMETMLRRKVEAIQVLQVPWSLWVHPSPRGRKSSRRRKLWEAEQRGED